MLKAARRSNFISRKQSFETAVHTICCQMSQELQMLSSVTLDCQVTKIVRIQVLNYQNCNQCLKSHKSLGLSKLSEIVKVVRNCKSCQTFFRVVRNCQKMLDLSEIVKKWEIHFFSLSGNPFFLVKSLFSLGKSLFRCASISWTGFVLNSLTPSVTFFWEFNLWDIKLIN